MTHKADEKTGVCKFSCTYLCFTFTASCTFCTLMQVLQVEGHCHVDFVVCIGYLYIAHSLLDRYALYSQYHIVVPLLHSAVVIQA